MGILDRIRKATTAPASQQSSSGIKSKVESRKVKAVDAAEPIVGAGTKTEEATPVLSAAKSTKLAGDEYSFRWLKRPHISEKAAMSTERGVYVFVVPVNAEKIAIKKAVEALYKVNVIRVNTIRRIGKAVRRGRTSGIRKDWKKAIVSIKKGQKIDLYEGV